MQKSEAKQNVATENASGEKPACAARRYEITKKDLPLCCPMPDMELWNAHPRVYLPIEAEKHVVCPYCDAEFILK